MLVLQIFSALLLLFNKIFVYKKKTIGWVFGIFGTIAITIYFYLQMVIQHKNNLWIMVVYDIALLFLMIYGYLVSSSAKQTKLHILLEKNALSFKAVVVTVTLIVCMYLLVQAMLANLVVVQFASALGGLIGTLLLAFHKKVTSKIGWIFYFFTHLIVVYLMYKTDSPFLALCQVASAYVAYLGFRNESKK